MPEIRASIPLPPGSCRFHLKVVPPVGFLPPQLILLASDSRSNELGLMSWLVHRALDHSILSSQIESDLIPRAHRLHDRGEKVCPMSQLSKVKTSRHQWKSKAQQRGDDNRYLRKQLARVKAQRHQAKRALKAAQARLHQVESQAQAMVGRAKADVAWLALRLFLEARISFRAVSRVLALLADALGIRRAPCPQTVINWVTRLSMVRIACARQRLTPSLSPNAFSNGFIWMIDLSIALGSGKILAILALDAHHHQRTPHAPSLHQVHCIGVSVADSWTGEAIAEVLRRLIATLGRPTAYLKDGGGELRKAVEVLAEDGLSSPAIDDLSHAAAGMLSAIITSTPLLSVLSRPVDVSRPNSSKRCWPV